MTKRRVVITGLGMVSPLGNTVEQSWSNLIKGHSGIELITDFDTSTFATKFAAQVKNFDASKFISPKDRKKMDLFIQYGLVAGIQAVEDAKLDMQILDRNRIGLAIGSGIGGLSLIEENHLTLIKQSPRRVSPFFIPSTIINMVAGQLSIHYQLNGPSISIATACTSGVHNIGHAARMITYGDADIMLTGGSEKASTQLGLAGFGALRALSTYNENPQMASRPWDIQRDGFVLGDGAGILVLEEYEHAKARNAKIYAELVGFGMSSDGYHMTSPPQDGKGAVLAMHNALIDGKVAPSEIGYVNAHGTSTPVGDLVEAKAIEHVFAGQRIKPLVSSTKSMTGHLLGAAGAVESIFSILSLKYQQVPPTMNLEKADPNIHLDLVPNEARNVEDLNYVMCNAFGFGGTNSSLLFKRISS